MRLKTIKINFFVLIGLLLLIELTGQIIFVIKNKNFLFSVHDNKSRERLFSLHPNLSVALNKNAKEIVYKNGEYLSITTTELGTRWTGADLKDSSKIRIACIGGSTTFCTGVSDEFSWPAMLQKKLGVGYAVVNYGVPAYTTVESIIQLALFVPEIKPDIVIFFEGGNDMYNYYMENSYPDYFWHGEVAMPMALMKRKKYESCFEKFKKQSGFFYITDNINEKFTKEKLPERFTVPDPKIDSLYVRNVRTQIAITSSWNKPAIFIGQILNPFIERKEYPWSIRIQSKYILPIMTHVNELTKNASNASIYCSYLDFKNSIKWNPEHFWDDMHFTIKGNEIFSDMLSAEIKKIRIEK